VVIALTAVNIAFLLPRAAKIDPEAFKPGGIIVYDPPEKMDPRQRAALEAAALLS